jgi:hypothetical protein
MAFHLLPMLIISALGVGGAYAVYRYRETAAMRRLQQVGSMAYRALVTITRVGRLICEVIDVYNQAGSLLSSFSSYDDWSSQPSAIQNNINSYGNHTEQYYS